MTPMSPVLHLLHHVNAFHGFGGRGRQFRSEHALRAALRLAIRFNFNFEMDDFVILACSPEEVRGKKHHPHGLEFVADELDYAMTCGANDSPGNVNAARAFEHFKQRKPFLLGAENDPFSRIYVGRKFKWEGDEVECTSFTDDGAMAITCVYELLPGHGRKIIKKYWIERSDLPHSKG